MQYYILRGFREHTKISITPNKWIAYDYIDSIMRSELSSQRLSANGMFDFLLYDESLLTDTVMDFAGENGIFMSDKFRDVLDSVSLPPHNYFQASLTQKGRIYRNYQFMLIPYLSMIEPLFDVQQSEFYSVDGYYGDDHSCIGPIRFNSWEEAAKSYTHFSLYERVSEGTMKPLGSHNEAKLVLTPNATQYDLIGTLRGSMIGYYISEKLYIKLTEAGITGIQMVEAPWVRRA